MLRVKLFKSLCPCTQILYITIPDNFINYRYAVLVQKGGSARIQYAAVPGKHFTNVKLNVKFCGETTMV